jgi:hypothetical protein
MSMPYSVANTINGGGFKSQVKPDEFDKSVDLRAKQQNSSNGKTPSQPIAPKERLLNLSEGKRRAVQVVRRYPGCDSVIAGNLLNISRNAALATLNPLADLHGVLKSDKCDESRGGARKAIHFWLADDIPAELVDAILGSSDADPDAILEAHDGRSKMKPEKKPKQGSELDPVAAFTSLSPLVKDLAVAIGRTGTKGIRPTELTKATGQKLTRIYDRVQLLLDQGLATKQPVPGFKNQSFYVPSLALREIVEQLPPQQVEDANSASATDFSPTSNEEHLKMPSKEQSPGNSFQENGAESTEEISQVWEVVTVIVRKFKSLESRLNRIESSLQGKERVKAKDLLEILNSEDQ